MNWMTAALAGIAVGFSITLVRVLLLRGH